MASVCDSFTGRCSCEDGGVSLLLKKSGAKTQPSIGDEDQERACYRADVASLGSECRVKLTVGSNGEDVTLSAECPDEHKAFGKPWVLKRVTGVECS